MLQQQRQKQQQQQQQLNISLSLLITMVGTLIVLMRAFALFGHIAKERWRLRVERLLEECSRFTGRSAAWFGDPKTPGMDEESVPNRSIRNCEPNPRLCKV